MGHSRSGPNKKHGRKQNRHARNPLGIAKFDSATGMAWALARFLNGHDFAGLGQSRILQAIARQADWMPRHLRERIFATLGAQEGVARDAIEKVNTAAIAEWLTGLYPARRYPAVMIGSSNGALMHIGAALGVPWLPQTILTLVDQKHVHPDDPVHAMEAEQETAQLFSERVEDYLQRYDSPVRRWDPPPPDNNRPEAEWGFEPALREDVIDFAQRRGIASCAFALTTLNTRVRSCPIWRCAIQSWSSGHCSKDRPRPLTSAPSSGNSFAGAKTNATTRTGWAT